MMDESFTLEVDGYRAECTLGRSPATGLWVSRCPDMRIVTQGTTAEQARDSLRDAIALTRKYAPKPAVAEGSALVFDADGEWYVLVEEAGS